MRQVLARIKPVTGFSHTVYIGLTALLPALMYVFIRLGIPQLALALVLLSKWRMFAVKPRHWLANVRVNGVDLVVGLSVLIFMIQSDTALWQLVWAGTYALWQLVLKPRSGTLAVSTQAIVGQLAGLMALFLAFGDAPIAVLMALTWGICYLSSRHFFANFDEPLASFLSHFWGYFGAALVWLLSHWLLFYGVVAQPTLLLAVISFGLGGLYYLEETDRMSLLMRRQLIFVMIAVVVIVIAFSDWGDKTV